MNPGACQVSFGSSRQRVSPRITGGLGTYRKGPVSTGTSVLYYCQCYSVLYYVTSCKANSLSAQSHSSLGMSLSKHPRQGQDSMFVLTASGSQTRGSPEWEHFEKLRYNSCEEKRLLLSVPWMQQSTWDLVTFKVFWTQQALSSDLWNNRSKGWANEWLLIRAFLGNWLNESSRRGTSKIALASNRAFMGSFMGSL